MSVEDTSELYVTVTYPLLISRYKATLVDFCITLCVVILVLITGSLLEEPRLFTIPVIIIFLMSYEPLLTVYSCTPGQRLMGIRVRDGHDPFRRINIWQSYARFFVKYLLGLVSFITIHQNDRRRALHDYAGTTVMVSAECLK